MIWHDMRAKSGAAFDPERELELRLAAQARAGAAWAVSALVARYQPPVVRYLVRLTGDREGARALAEQIFVRMGKRLRGPHGGVHLRLWLLRAATEAGLDALRHPERHPPQRLGAPEGPAALLAEPSDAAPSPHAPRGSRTRRRAAPVPQAQPPPQEFVWQDTPSAAGASRSLEPTEDPVEQSSPREAMRNRMVRAVLAELPYGDALCLALHLVAGLNQTEAAQALGLAPAVTRHRIVQGLQLFGRRYEAALASLGLSPNAVAGADPPVQQPPNRLPSPDASKAEPLERSPRKPEPEFVEAIAVRAELPDSPRPEPVAMPTGPYGTELAPPAADVADLMAPETDAEADAVVPPEGGPEPAPEASIGDPATDLAASSVTVAEAVPQDTHLDVEEVEAAASERWPTERASVEAPEDETEGTFDSGGDSTLGAPVEITDLVPTDPDDLDAIDQGEHRGEMHSTEATVSSVSSALAQPGPGRLPVVTVPLAPDKLLDASALGEDAPADRRLLAPDESIGPRASDDEDYVLVVEAEPRPQDEALARAQALRRARVLSADGEAEDPSDSQLYRSLR